MDNPATLPLTTEPPASDTPPQVFTQADVDRIVKARLADEGKRGRNEGKREIEQSLGMSLEDALAKLKALTTPSNAPVPQPSQESTEAPAWAKGILSKVEQLEQQLAQTNIEKKRLEVQSKASKAGVFPELLDLIDTNSEDVDSAIQTILDKQRAIVETRVPVPAKKPAPPTLHAGATSQPLTAPPEQDITSREEALKIKRGGSR